MALFRNLGVNLRDRLCDVQMYVSAQSLDFLDLAKNCSFLNWKLVINRTPITKEKTMPQRILVIDDEPDMLMLLRMMIEENTDHEVETTNNPSEGIKLFSEKDYDLVITDLKMPGLDGIELFDEFQEIKPDIPMVMITAYGSIETADEAMKKGIADFITKPFRKDTILFTINRVLELARVKKENIELKKKLDVN